MAIQDRNLTAGTRLTATYKKEVHFCDVEVTEEGKMAFVLDDGRRFKSASSAASALMDGKAVNGWLFWSVDSVSAAHSDNPTDVSPLPERGRVAKSSKRIYRNPNQLGIAAGKVRYFCRACMKGFIVDSGSEPEACPEGHSADSETESKPAPSS